MHHFFPAFLSWLKAFDDPRNKKSITYPPEVLLWVGILMFILKLGARRQINFDFQTASVIKNLAFLSKQNLQRIPDDDTLAYYYSRFNPAAFDDLRRLMINELMRRKSLVKERLFGYYLIALDGTGHLVYNRRHCPYCLIKKKRGKVLYYYHQVVEAKLVTANGFALSMATEFVENWVPGQTKQDCELKAAYRLLVQLAKRFPQLRICLVLDSLYVSEGILNICEQYNWRYIIVFKKGSAPELYQEYEVLKKRCAENCLVYDWEKKEEKQYYHWVTDIDYKFEGRHYVNILECLVIKKKLKKHERPRTRWLWLTNFPINKDNCMILANEGGRLRFALTDCPFHQSIDRKRQSA